MESDAGSNNILDINEQKTINITGQNNKYQMKKLSRLLRFNNGAA